MIPETSHISPFKSAKIPCRIPLELEPQPCGVVVANVGDPGLLAWLAYLMVFWEISHKSKVVSTFGTHTKQPLPTGYKWIPFIVVFFKGDISSVFACFKLTMCNWHVVKSQAASFEKLQGIFHLRYLPWSLSELSPAITRNGSKSKIGNLYTLPTKMELESRWKRGGFGRWWFCDFPVDFSLKFHTC